MNDSEVFSVQFQVFGPEAIGREWSENLRTYPPTIDD